MSAWRRQGSAARRGILVFAGSIRAGALSQKLADVAAKELALAEADVTKVSLADYPLPIYNGDLEATKGVPENAKKLARLIAAQQGVFIATPEYNNSPPPLLVNTIAWVSRRKARAPCPTGTGSIASAAPPTDDTAGRAP